MPLLAAMFSAVGIIGGWLVGVVMIGVDEGSFWSQMQGGVEVWNDVGNGVIKSMVFGVAVTFVALYQGYMAHPTPEGVSSATTRLGGHGFPAGAGAGLFAYRHDVQHLMLAVVLTDLIATCTYSSSAKP